MYERIEIFYFFGVSRQICLSFVMACAKIWLHRVMNSAKNERINNLRGKEKPLKEFP